MTTVTKRTHSTDLVIIGAGGAGLTAAATALESGLTDIVILEKAASPGGNTAQSAGMFAVGSPAQKRKGIEIPAQSVFREKMQYANWRIDPELTRACIDRSGGMIEWLENKGMHFDSVVEFLREGQSPKVFHSFSPGPAGFIGKTVVDTLADELLRRGVQIRKDTAATSLLRAAGGLRRIVGATARSEEGELQIDAKAVVLATGGFGASRELLERFFPGHGDVFTKGYPEMTGDGLTMAEATGATVDDNMLLLLTGPHAYPWSHVLTLLVRRPELLLVNKLGERYCDETIFLDYHTEAGNALSRQPDKICYGLLDSGVKERMVSSGEIVSGMEREAGDAGGWLKELEQELEAGVTGKTVMKAATWEDLARQMGAGPETLGETVARYNTHCDRGYDEEFSKEKAFLLPLRKPPFYAVLGRQGFDTTLGGIKVDHRLRVVDRQGRPIPGLYAVGDCASQWEYTNYNLRHPGSAMTFALCSGFIAGQEAAGYARQSHS